MRHSRRLSHSHHANQPRGPFCVNCAVNLSPFAAFLRCADPACANIPICVDCFSVGAAHHPPHRPDHPYRVIEKLAQPVYAPDWAAHEELRLLEALSEHGPYHWKPVADYVGKTPRKCEIHYEHIYLNGLNAPLPTSILGQPVSIASVASPAASTDGMEDPDTAPDTKPGVDNDRPVENERKLKNKDVEPESGKLEGFMPLRGDFDVEWDDTAEELIADLVINDDDTEEEVDLKSRLVLMYNERLQRRNAVKDFLFDHNLFDFSALKYKDRRSTRDEKELSARLQVFSRLLDKNEFEAFYNSVMTEYRISRDVYKLAQARMAGLRTKTEIDVYEVERKVRYQRLSADAKERDEDDEPIEKLKRPSNNADSPAKISNFTQQDGSVPGTPGSIVMSTSKFSPHTKAANGDLESAPNTMQVRKARERKRIARSPYPILEAMPVDHLEDAWKLSQTEKKLCSSLRIPPADFLRMRDAMLYTATQQVRRRGRPRKRDPSEPVLTIRASRQTSVAPVLEKEPPKPTSNPGRNLIFNQGLLLRAKQSPVDAETVPSESRGVTPRVTLNLTNLKRDVVPKNSHPGPSAMSSHLPKAPASGGLYLSMKLESARRLSSTAASSSERLPRSGNAPGLTQDSMISKTGESSSLSQLDAQSSLGKAEETRRNETFAGTETSKEELIYVSTVEKPRPMTRAYARRSLPLQEEVKTKFTTVVRPTGTRKWPARPEGTAGAVRDVFRVTTRSVQRPVTPSCAEQKERIEKAEVVKHEQKITRDERISDQEKEGTGAFEEEKPTMQDETALDREKKLTGNHKEKESTYVSNAETSELLVKTSCVEKTAVEEGTADGDVKQTSSRGERSSQSMQQQSLVTDKSPPSPAPSTSKGVESEGKNFLKVQGPAALAKREVSSEGTAGKLTTTAAHQEGLPDAAITCEKVAISSIASNHSTDSSVPDAGNSSLAGAAGTVDRFTGGIKREESHTNKDDIALDDHRDKKVFEAPNSGCGQKSKGGILQGRKTEEMNEKHIKDDVDSDEILAEDIAVSMSSDSEMENESKITAPSNDLNQLVEHETGPSTDRTIRRTRLQEGSRDAEELLDQGQASQCSTPPETPRPMTAARSRKHGRKGKSVTGKRGGKRSVAVTRAKSEKDTKRTSNRVEETTLDEGKDESEDVRDAIWSSCDMEEDADTHTGNGAGAAGDDVPLESRTCQTEIISVPASPDTTVPDGEIVESLGKVSLRSSVGTQLGTKETSSARETCPPSRRSTRILKRSRRGEESDRTPSREPKRRKSSRKTSQTAPEKAPGNMIMSKEDVRMGSPERDECCAVRISTRGASQPEIRESPARAARQSTSTRPKVTPTEKRITRSAGKERRLTRSQSGMLRVKSSADKTMRGGR